MNHLKIILLCKESIVLLDPCECIHNFTYCPTMRNFIRVQGCPKMRDVSEDEFQPEQEPTNEENIYFESDQENAAPI